jgi:hypothetical protein
VDLFDARIQGLFGDVRPDCIVVCLPEEIADLRVETLCARRASLMRRAGPKSIHPDSLANVPPNLSCSKVPSPAKSSVWLEPRARVSSLPRLPFVTR